MAGAFITARGCHIESVPGTSSGGIEEPSIAKVRVPRPVNPASRLPLIPGLDLVHIGYDDRGATAPASEGRVARLTLQPNLQRFAQSLLAAHKFPEASVVMIDTATGHVIVYASYIDNGPPRDLCVEATAPAASIFKVVTGAALVEDSRLTPDTRQCYAGGGTEGLGARDLVDDPARDKWCVTLAGAMGRSLNPVFARLAIKHLKPFQLEVMARNFGFGEPVPFDVPVQASGVTIPSEPLEFARTSAGFWNTTLSPLEAAWIGTTLARGGEAVRPMIVKDLAASTGEVLYSAPPAPLVRHAVTRETAAAVTTMMESTVREGTSFRAFHDMRKKSFLPGISVAGKTGTLSDARAHRYYTWFMGFAPSRPQADLRTVAVAVLVVNQPEWQVKANVVARDMLRAYFSELTVPRVTKPSPAAIARRKR